MLKHRVTAPPTTPDPASCSSLGSCVSQSIDVMPNDDRASDSSSVVDSSSEDETTNKVAEIVQNRQVQDILRGMDMAPRFDQVNVADGTELTIGSRMVFEGGSSVTFVVNENKTPVGGGVVPRRRSSDNVANKQGDDQSDTEKTISWSRFKRLKLRKKMFLGSFLCLFITTIVGFTVAFTVLTQQPNTISSLAPSTTTKTCPSTTASTSTSTTSTTTTTTSTTTTSITTKIDSKLINVTREDWGARPPSGNIEVLTIPVDTVIVTSTETIGCFTDDACIPRLKEIQTQQMDNHYDVVYNLLLSTDGQVYEGRGLDKVSECAAGDIVNGSLCVGFFGTFKHYSPVPKQLDIFEEVIRRGVELGLIAHNYRICGEQDLSKTAAELLFKMTRIERWRGVVPDCLENL